MVDCGKSYGKLKDNDVMPTYVYKCEPCNLEFEVVQKIASAPAKCKKCKKVAKIQIPKATTFVLKGGGWANSGYSK